MTDRELMQQALEALESVYGRGKKCDAAITALRAALDAPESDQVERMYAFYQQAASQRDELMAHQSQIIQAMRKLPEAHEVIFKACVNLPHWKRTAIRYLKRNNPSLYERAITEFNEHPDGRASKPN